MAIEELNLNQFWLQSPSSAESCQGQLQRLWASSLLSFASIIYILSCLIPQAALLPCVLLVANALCCFISGVNHSEEALHSSSTDGSFFPGHQGNLHGETEAQLGWGWWPAWRQPGRRELGWPRHQSLVLGAGVLALAVHREGVMAQVDASGGCVTGGCGAIQCSVGVVVAASTGWMCREPAVGGCVTEQLGAQGRCYSPVRFWGGCCEGFGHSTRAGFGCRVGSSSVNKMRSWCDAAMSRRIGIPCTSTEGDAAGVCEKQDPLGKGCTCPLFLHPILAPVGQVSSLPSQVSW